MPGDVDGMVCLNAVVLEAVCTEPLKEVNDRLEFDAESLFRRLLFLSEEKGRA